MQTANGSTDCLRLQRSRTGERLHFLEWPEVRALLQTKTVCITAKAGSCAADAWCRVQAWMGLLVPGILCAHSNQHALPQST